MIAGTLLQVHV